MLKRFIPVAGAFALMVGALVGCQDTMSTSPESNNSVTTQSQDPYLAYLAPEEAFNDFQDAPTFDQVMNDPSFLAPPADDPGRGGPGRGGDDSLEHRDTTKHGRDTTKHHGRDTTHRKRPDSLHKGPRDTTHKDTSRHGKRPEDSLRLKPINYGQIVSQLRLTKGQDSAIRNCFRELNECTRAHAERYRNALKGLRDSLQAELRAIRAAVEAGEMTREEAKARIERLVRKYRGDAAALEAAYKRAIEQCRREFERCVASHLTPEQLRKWEQMIHRR